MTIYPNAQYSVTVAKAGKNRVYRGYAVTNVIDLAGAFCLGGNARRPSSTITWDWGSELALWAIITAFAE